MGTENDILSSFHIFIKILFLLRPQVSKGKQVLLKKKKKRVKLLNGELINCRVHLAQNCNISILYQRPLQDNSFHIFYLKQVEF